MAEANFDDFGEGGVSLRGLPTQKLINLAGGATSLLLVLGLAVWGYRLAVRDVNGIPVIQAMQGPMRIMPEDPGGQIAANVGLTVNRVAADAEGLPRTDNIILAPAPVQLSDGDLAPADRPTPAPAAAPAAPAQPQTAVAAPAPVTSAAPYAAPAPDAAVAAVPAPDATQAVAHSAPVTSPRPKAAPAFLLPAAVAKAAPVKAVPAPVVPAKAETAPAPSAAAAAVRAVAIPATAAKAPPARPASVSAPAKPAKAPDSIDPAKLAPGTRLVQLGAYDTPDAAASAWAMIKAKFGDQMDGKSRVIQKATSGGRDFYRLRAAGFKDDADTRRFCTTFDAANAPCVPVVLR